jgi:hypothetical protein
VGRGSVPQDLQAHGKACLQAKIAAGEIVHIDASLIRANVSWESLIERHVVEVLDENNIEVEKQDRQSGKYKKVCVTDPDATMATNARNRHLEPCYKQHNRRSHRNARRRDRKREYNADCNPAPGSRLPAIRWFGAVWLSEAARHG